MQTKNQVRDSEESKDQDFQIGDTVRFRRDHNAAGSTGVIVALEVWLDDNKTVAWNGVGEPPQYTGKHGLSGMTPRFLIRLMTFHSQAGDRGAELYRARCLSEPHDYPWLWAGAMDLVARPEIRKFDDSGVLGSVIGRCAELDLSRVSDSIEGARAEIAKMKSFFCIPLKPKDETR